MCHVNRDSLTHCSQGSVAQLVEQRTSNPKVVGLKCSKWVLFDYFQNISRNWHFVTHFDPLKKLRRKCLIMTIFFSTNKQQVKIKLMQNETNHWSI